MFVVKKRTSTIACAITAPKNTAEPRTPRRKKRDQEQAENTAVKNRRQDVAGLDEIFHEGAERGDGNGDQAPACGQPPGRDDVMMVGVMGSEDSIEIHGGRGPQGVEDGGRGGHRRAENY